MSRIWKDAYESQMETWRWCRSEYGFAWRQASLEVSQEKMARATQMLLASLYAIEEDKLLVADPYFVSREFCEVVGAASESFEPEPILPTDFLSTSGYVFFEAPFTIPDRHETEIEFGGFSWTPIFAMDEESAANTRKVILGEKLSDADTVIVHVGESPPGDSVIEVGSSVRGPFTLEAPVRERFEQIGVALSLYSMPTPDKWLPEHGWRPRRLPIHHTPWYYGMGFDGNQFDSLGIATGVSSWWKIAQTTLRLMQQRLAHTPRVPADRPTRREAKRYGFNDREITVVRLRREGGDRPLPGHEPQEANYSHRFIVSGHWRNQWYAASQMHRQIWISPYVKGPEDQPLVVSPRRVYEVVR